MFDVSAFPRHQTCALEAEFWHCQHLTGQSLSAGEPPGNAAGEDVAEQTLGSLPSVLDPKTGNSETPTGWHGKGF